MNSRDKVEREFIKASGQYLALLEKGPDKTFLRGRGLLEPEPMDYETALEIAKRKVDFWRELLRDETERLGAAGQQTDKKTSLSHTEKAVRTIQAGHFHERRTFERFAKKYIKDNKPSTKTETIRAFKTKFPPGENFNNVPDKTIRKWFSRL